MVIKLNSKFHLLLIFYFLSTAVFSQYKVKVQAKGISISRGITPKQALEEAVKDAQINALRKAGISEQVSISTILINESKGKTIKNYFNEISSIESNANIVTDSVYSEKRSFDEYNNMVVSVEIDATVFKYGTKKDANLFFNIEGLKEVYYEDEFISFSFVPSQDGYLKIFVVNEKEVMILYPFEDQVKDYLSDVKNQLFKKGENIIFPIHEAYKPGYSIELDSKTNEEKSILIFVFTKNNIPFIKSKVSLRAILNWIYNIPIDQRDLFYQNIILKRLN